VSLLTGLKFHWPRRKKATGNAIFAPKKMLLLA